MLSLGRIVYVKRHYYCFLQECSAQRTSVNSGKQHFFAEKNSCLEEPASGVIFED